MKTNYISNKKKLSSKKKAANKKNFVDQPVEHETNNKQSLGILDNINTNDFRPPPPFTYPSHQKGPLIEEYFYNSYGDIECSFNYLPIFWTNIYTIMAKYPKKKPPISLQEIIDSLDKKKKYFAIVQHDNGIQEDMPDNVLIFSSGGKGHIPIPLLCDAHPKQNEERNIFASFVGVVNDKINDHNGIRTKMRKTVFTPQHPDFHCIEGKNDISIFEKMMSKSIFALCPRGFGKTSFRMYEAIQMGCIPVYIYDDPCLPYQHKINWEDFSVLYHVDDLPHLADILHSYSEEKIKKMQIKLEELYPKYFTFDSVCQDIMQTIQFMDKYNISIGDNTYRDLIKKTNSLNNQNKKITFAIPSYNEFSDIHPGQSIADCIRWPLQDDRIDEIVISDDCSEHFDKLENLVKDLPKVKLYRNEKNLGTFGNKKKVVSLSSNDWVILFDSDNICDKTYVDNLYSLRWDDDTIYHPVYAFPKFDYREQSGEIWTLEKAPILINKYGKSLTNVGNFFFNKNTYLDVLSPYPYDRFDLSLPNYHNLHWHIRKDFYWRLVFDPWDAVFVFKEWLFAGNKIKMVEDQQYFHLVSSDSTSKKAPQERIKLFTMYIEELSRRKKFDKTIDIIEYLHYNCWDKNHPEYNLYPWEFYRAIYNLLIQDNIMNITQIGCFTLFIPRVVHEIIKAKPDINYNIYNHTLNTNRGIFDYTDECCPNIYNNDKYGKTESDILIIEDGFESDLLHKNILSFCQGYKSNIIYLCDCKTKHNRLYNDVISLDGRVAMILIKDNTSEYLCALVSPKGSSCFEL